MKTLKHLPNRKMCVTSDWIRVKNQKMYWMDGQQCWTFNLDNVSIHPDLDVLCAREHLTLDYKTQYRIRTEKVNNAFNIEEEKLKINNTNFTQHVSLLDPDDFPDIPSCNPDYSITLDADAFIKTLKNMVLFVSKDPAKEQLNEIFCKVISHFDHLEMMASDGKKLAIKNLCINNYTDNIDEKQKESKLIWNFPLLTSIAKTIIKCKPDGKITIGSDLDENRIKISFGNTEVTYYYHYSNFPDYKALLPDINDRVATFSTMTKVLRDELKTVKQVGKDLAYRINLNNNRAISIEICNPETTEKLATLNTSLQHSQEQYSFLVRASWIDDILKNNKHVVFNFFKDKALCLVQGDDLISFALMKIRENRKDES